MYHYNCLWSPKGWEWMPKPNGSCPYRSDTNWRGSGVWRREAARDVWLEAVWEWPETEGRKHSMTSEYWAVTRDGRDWRSRPVCFALLWTVRDSLLPSLSRECRVKEFNQPFQSRPKALVAAAAFISVNSVKHQYNKMVQLNTAVQIGCFQHLYLT